MGNSFSESSNISNGNLHLKDFIGDTDTLDFSRFNCIKNNQEIYSKETFQKEMQLKDNNKFTTQKESLGKDCLYSALKELGEQYVQESILKAPLKGKKSFNKGFQKETNLKIYEKEKEIKNFYPTSKKIKGELHELEKLKEVQISRSDKFEILQKNQSSQKEKITEFQENLEQQQKDADTNFFEKMKQEKSFKNSYVTKEDLGLAIKISDAFLKITERINKFESITNLTEFDQIKESLEAQFASESEPLLSSVFNSFINIIKHYMQSISYKYKESSGNSIENTNDITISQYFSSIDYENLFHSLADFEIFKHVSNKYISDYKYFKVSLGSKSQSLQNALNEVLDSSMDPNAEDFFILNDNFLMSIQKNEYQRAAFLKEKIKFYFLKAKYNQNFFNEENLEYEKLCFEKNETLFNEKFKDKNKQYYSKHKDLSVDNFNPHEKFRFYLIKSITNYFLNLSKVLTRDDFLIDLSNAYIILNSKSFEDYSTKLQDEKDSEKIKDEDKIKINYCENQIKVKDKVFLNLEMLEQFKALFYKLFEANLLNCADSILNVNSETIFENFHDQKDGRIAKESLKVIVKLHAYYLLFGKQSDCNAFLSEQSFKNMQQMINEITQMKKDILATPRCEKEFDSGDADYSNYNKSNFPSNNNNIDNSNNNNSNNNNNNINNNNNNINKNNNNNNRHNPNPLDPSVNINMQMVSDDPTIKHKILSIDGGGMKSIFVVYLLRELEISLGKSIYDLFDFFTGSSVGGWCCLALAFNIYTAESIFRETVGVLYKNTVWINSTFKRGFNKIKSALLFSSAVYSENLFETILQHRLRKKLNNNNNEEFLSISHESKNFLITVSKKDLAKNILIPYCFSKFNGVCELNRISFNQATGDAVEFHPETLGQNINVNDVKIWEVVRATTAAYPFFRPKQIGDMSFVDGGYQFNNPSLLALE